MYLITFLIIVSLSCTNALDEVDFVEKFSSLRLEDFKTVSENNGILNPLLNSKNLSIITGIK